MTAVYVFFMLEFYALFSTLAAGPYEALLPELAPTSPERVSLQAIKVYLGLAGTAIGLVGSTILRDAVGFPARRGAGWQCWGGPADPTRSATCRRARSSSLPR